MVRMTIGAFVISRLTRKDERKILPPPPDTLSTLFKQQPPLSMEIQLPPQLSFEMLPPPPPPMSSSLEYISSPDNDSVEELPQLPSPPLPAPWRPQLPRVGGQLPPVGCLNRRQMNYLYDSGQLLNPPSMRKTFNFICFCLILCWCSILMHRLETLASN